MGKKGMSKMGLMVALDFAFMAAKWEHVKAAYYGDREKAMRFARAGWLLHMLLDVANDSRGDISMEGGKIAWRENGRKRRGSFRAWVEAAAKRRPYLWLLVAEELELAEELFQLALGGE